MTRYRTCFSLLGSQKQLHWKAKSATYWSRIESVHETETKIDKILYTLFNDIYLLSRYMNLK